MSKTLFMVLSFVVMGLHAHASDDEESGDYMSRVKAPIEVLISLNRNAHEEEMAAEEARVASLRTAGLQAENAALHARLEATMQERDRAMHDRSIMEANLREAGAAKAVLVAVARTLDPRTALSSESSYAALVTFFTNYAIRAQDATRAAPAAAAAPAAPAASGSGLFGGEEDDAY